VYTASDGSQTERTCLWKDRPPKIKEGGKEYFYDFTATASTQTPPPEPYFGSALGCLPEEVGEFRKAFPHHEYNDQGDVKIKSPAHRESIARERGFIE
jgi:hypothetical protein